MGTVFDSQVNWRATKAVVPSFLVGAAGGAASTNNIIYTVPSGFTFFLTYMFYRMNTDSSGTASDVHVRDAAGTFQWNLAYGSGVPSQIITGAVSFSVPLPHPSGYTFRVQNTANSNVAYVQLIGWLE